MEDPPVFLPPRLPTMSRTRLLLLGLAALGLAACQDALAPVDFDEQLTPRLSVQQVPERVVPGRVLARLVDGADAAAVAATNGLAFERTSARGRLAIFRGAVGNERALAARLGGDDRVVYAEPDYLRQPTVDPRMWSLDNDGAGRVLYTRGRNSGSPVPSLLPVADADIDGTDPGTLSGSDVAIASIDTGVEMDHPEFAGGANVVPGWDFYSGDSDPSDTNDHGTHTTGTMVGNSVGVAGAVGLAARITVHVYRVCGGNGCPTSAIVDAIDAAAAQGVVAMNLSLGGGSLSQAEAQAIADATAAGSLVIAAAGNDGTGTVSCPACDPNAISVAATDWADQHAYYTNWGSGLDIAAPGGELYSNTTSEAGIWSSVRGGGYAYFQGTSMATPHVTGAAAVVASVRGLTVADATRSETIRALLLCNTDDLGAGGYDEDFGNGRLNLAKAASGAAETSCAMGGGAGSGGGGGGGGGGGDDGGAFTISVAIGKVRGYNALRIDSLSNGATTGSLTMTRSDGSVALSVDPFTLGEVYRTQDKSGATYTLEVCVTETNCSTQTLVY